MPDEVPNTVTPTRHVPTVRVDVSQRLSVVLGCAVTLCCLCYMPSQVKAEEWQPPSDVQKILDGQKKFIDSINERNKHRNSDEFQKAEKEALRKKLLDQNRPRPRNRLAETFLLMCFFGIVGAVRHLLKWDAKRAAAAKLKTTDPEIYNAVNKLADRDAE